MVTLSFLFGMMFCPFNIMNRPARMEILRVLFDVAFSPFRPVYFRNFFMADVITSSKILLSDSCAMICFYTSGEYTSHMPLTCSWVGNANYIWGILPYWWRFWQCIRRCVDDPTLKTQRWNALKYFINICAGTAGIVYKENGG